MRTARHYVVLDGNGQPIAGGFADLADAMRCARTFGAHEVWLPSEAELVWSAYDATGDNLNEQV